MSGAIKEPNLNKLSDLIRELENIGAIKEYFLHHQYFNGELELNIEFDNDKADSLLLSSDIEESDCCAYWE